MLKNHLHQPITQLTVYSAEWCGDCLRVKALLDQHQISYLNFNIDEGAELAAFVERVNGGSRSIPTLLFPDGTVMVEPSNQELKEKLKLS